MKIEKNKMVSVTYELKDDKDKVIEVATKEKPLVFPFGTDLLLPAFENAILNKEVGDKFEVQMDSKNGYGERNEQMVVSLPRDTFMIDGKIDDDMLQVGNRLPMMAENGGVMNGIITDLKEGIVVMDFNHPLAGQDLHFTGEVIGVRDATEEELKKSAGEEIK